MFQYLNHPSPLRGPFACLGFRCRDSLTRLAKSSSVPVVSEVGTLVDLLVGFINDGQENPVAFSRSRMLCLALTEMLRAANGITPVSI